jgi:hypothetical protein
MMWTSCMCIEFILVGINYIVIVTNSLKYKFELQVRMDS